MKRLPLIIFCVLLSTFMFQCSIGQQETPSLPSQEKMLVEGRADLLPTGETVLYSSASYIEFHVKSEKITIMAAITKTTKEYDFMGIEVGGKLISNHKISAPIEAPQAITVALPKTNNADPIIV